MSTVAQPVLLTADEFMRLPENGKRRELVRGRLVEEDIPGCRHGKVSVKISRYLDVYVEERDLGHVMSNDTFVVTHHDPDTVRGSDICYFSYARMPKDEVPVGAAQQPPELVFEVKSPTDRWVKILMKTAEYLEAGVSVVCVVDPKEQTVSIYRPDQNATLLTIEQTLTIPDILSDFTVPIRKFFE